MKRSGKKFYTVREIAEILEIGEKAANNLVRQKNFPARRIGRKIIIHKSIFKRWFECKCTCSHYNYT